MEFALPETWILGASSNYFIDTLEPIKGPRICVPRKYYTTFVGKIHTHPYLMFQIKTQEKDLTVCLSGSHQEDSQTIIVPDWILEYLGLVHGEQCTLRFLTETLPEPVRHIECSVEITKQFCEDLGIDIRFAVETELSDLQILTTSMPFKINLREIDTQISGKILGLRATEWEIECGYVEPDSEVSVNFTFLEGDAAPEPTLEPITMPEPLPQPQLPPQPQLSAQERARLIRESWLKQLGTNSEQKNT